MARNKVQFQKSMSIHTFIQRYGDWLITSCRSANNIMPITIFLPAFIASFFYSA